MIAHPYTSHGLKVDSFVFQMSAISCMLMQNLNLMVDIGTRLSQFFKVSLLRFVFVFVLCLGDSHPTTRTQTYFSSTFMFLAFICRLCVSYPLCESSLDRSHVYNHPILKCLCEICTSVRHCFRTQKKKSRIVGHQRVFDAV